MSKCGRCNQQRGAARNTVNELRPQHGIATELRDDTDAPSETTAQLLTRAYVCKRIHTHARTCVPHA
eukprot:7868757-Lingulodinium_polyedra.AAC.1